MSGPFLLGCGYESDTKKKTADLKPAEYNPRKKLKPGMPEYEKLKRSIEQFGYVDPVIWNERTDRVVGGHQRLQVLRDLGVKQVQVSVVDLDETQEKALNVALNKVAGDWDEELLSVLLEELKDEGLAELAGFDPAELDALLNPLEDSEEIREDNFDAPGEAAKIINPVTKLGDVWSLGRHRLVCGDSTVISHVDKLMAGAKAQLVFTDPPYNVDYKGSTGKKILNDKQTDAAFYTFLYTALSNMFLVTDPGAGIYICHADPDAPTSEGYNFRKAMLDAGWLMKQCIIWAKNALVMGRSDYQWKHEPILYGWKPGAAHTWKGGRKQTTVWEDQAGVTVRDNGDHQLISIQVGVDTLVLKTTGLEVVFSGGEENTTVWRFDRPLRSAEHPTMKPIGIPARAIKNSSHSGDIVLDLFGGSGSTLIAAEQTGRVCYTMELDPVYCDVIVKRWEQFTGQQATLCT